MEYVDRVRTGWRRWRLVRAYQRAAAIRAGTAIRYGFVTYMIALDRLQDEGLIEIDDGDVEWDWPDDDR